MTRSSDRDAIKLEDPAAVIYWTDRLRVSEDRLKEVVAEVGSNANQVRRHIRGE